MVLFRITLLKGTLRCSLKTFLINNLPICESKALVNQIVCYYNSELVKFLHSQFTHKLSNELIIDYNGYDMLKHEIHADCNKCVRSIYTYMTPLKATLNYACVIAKIETHSSNIATHGSLYSALNIIAIYVF